MVLLLWIQGDAHKGITIPDHMYHAKIIQTEVCETKKTLESEENYLRLVSADACLF
jgi:hypothetical protein